MNDYNYIASLLENEDRRKTRVFFSLDYDVIFRQVCAFLNKDGGWIIITDRNCNQSKEEFLDESTVRTLEREISKDISPLPFVYVSLEKYKNAPAILITVVKGGKPPYAYKGKFYLEVGGDAITPTGNDLFRMLRESESSSDSWELDTSLRASISDLESKLIDGVRLHAKETGRIKAFMGDDNESFLSGLSLIDYEFVKNGGVALFGSDNEQIMPQCHVKIQLMDKGETGDRFVTHDLYGNIFSMMDWTFSQLKSILPTISTFKDDCLERLDRPVYPLSALREAIVNAFIHCDYSEVVAEIKVLVYPEKLTIINAGEMKAKLRNGVNLSGSVLRNPLMAEVLYIDGCMEKTGRGIPLIINSMKDYGYRMPEWKSENGFTTLTIFNYKPILSPRCKEFISTKSHGEAFTRKDYESFFQGKISAETAKKDIRLLVDNGLCRIIGNGRGSHYVFI